MSSMVGGISWLLSGQVPFGWLIHSSALVATFLGESQEGGHHAGVPKSDPLYRGNHGVARGNSSGFQVQSPVQVVTVSIHGISPHTWSEGVGEIDSSPGAVVGIIWFLDMAGLAAQGPSDLSGNHRPFQSLVLDLIFGENFCSHRWDSLSR